MAGDQFPVTRWSVVDAVGSSDPAEQARALDTLFAAYWKPVYKYVRLRWNQPTEDAQDLTQGFFAEMLERELLAKYNPAKSKLRTYLRLCVDSFVMNQQKAARRQKRGGNATHVALVLRFLCVPPSSANANSPWRREKALEAICAKATENDPAKRYASVSDLSSDVSRYLNGLPVSACEESIFDKAARFYRRYTVPILVIAVYLLVRTLILLFFHR